MFVLLSRIEGIMIHVLGSRPVKSVIVILITVDRNNEVTYSKNLWQFFPLNLGSKSFVIPLQTYALLKTGTHIVPPHPAPLLTFPTFQVKKG